MQDNFPGSRDDETGLLKWLRSIWVIHFTYPDHTGPLSQMSQYYLEWNNLSKTIDINFINIFNNNVKSVGVLTLRLALALALLLVMLI